MYFWIENTNLTDSAVPTITLTIVGSNTNSEKIESTVVYCWVLVQDGNVLGNSAYKYGTLSNGEITPTSGTANAGDLTGDSIDGGERSAQYTLYVWVDGTSVTEANRGNLSASIQVHVA